MRDEKWAAWYAEFIVNALRERAEGPGDAGTANPV